MRSVVVYESMFGNTERVAVEVAHGVELHIPVDLVNVDDIEQVDFSDVAITATGPVLADDLQPGPWMSGSLDIDIRLSVETTSSDYRLTAYASSHDRHVSAIPARPRRFRTHLARTATATQRPAGSGGPQSVDARLG